MILASRRSDFQAGLGFPIGIQRLNDIIEFGYNCQARFIWILQKEKTEHRFNMVSYDSEITTFTKHHKMGKITGVKSKEFLIWVPISEKYISDPASGKINFKTYTGLGRTLPVSGFLLQDEQKKKRFEEVSMRWIRLSCFSFHCSVCALRLIILAP